MKKSVFAVLIFLLVFSNAYAQSTQHDNLALTPGSGVLQTYTAGGTITAGHLLKTNSSGQVIETTTTDTGGFIGVAQANAVNGASVQVALIGQVNMVTDGACAPANYISNSILTNGIGHCGTSAPTTQIGIAQATSGGPGTIKVALSIGQSSSAQISLPGVSVVSNKLINDNDFVGKGPNPYADVMRFGGYFGPANPGTSTTGSITIGTPNLTLANAQDFANGQGILALGAGPATSLSTPAGVQVAPWGVTGATPYNYCVVAEDYFFGRTACSPAGASTTSVATLGIQSATNASYARVSGLVTVTTTGAHKFQAGAQFNMVKAMSGVPQLEGAFTIFTTPSPTTFTYTQYGFPDASGSLTGTSQVQGSNIVKWNSNLTNTVMRWYVYRCTASCGVIGPNYTYAGTATGVDGYFQDYGLSVNAASNGNGDVPATAPTTATNTALFTTILSGGGTTSLTLANSAGATVAGAKVFHDNTPNLVAACNSLLQGGITYIPNSNVSANWFPINSPFKLSSCPTSTQLQVGNKVWANAPIVMSGFQSIQGLPSGGGYGIPAFYDFRPLATIAGFAFPLIYFSPLVGNDISLDDLLLSCDQAYQACIYQDQNTSGGSLTGARYRHVHTLAGSALNTTWVAKGGFGHFWEYGGWSNGNTTFASPPAMLFSMNCGLGNTGQQQAYLVTMANTYNMGGIQFDNCNQPSPIGMNVMSFRDMIMESGAKPMFRFANTGAIGTPAGNVAYWEIVRPNFADATSGQSTPIIDTTMAQLITGLHIVSPSGNQGTLIETGNGTVTGLEISADYTGIVGAQSYTIPGAGIFSNVPVTTSGSLGHFAYQMALPSPAQSAIVSAGGAVPLIGGISNGPTHIYTIAAVDFSGNETTLSTGVNATVSGGNQTVTVTLPASFPSGAKGVNIYRDAVRVSGGGCSNPQFTTPGGTFADTSASSCGVGAPNTNSAGSSLLDANGLGTTKLIFTNQPQFKLSLLAPALTADRAPVFPDAAGTFVLDTATQTLSNKTLTSPSLNTPALTTPTIGGGTTLTKYSRLSSAQSPALVAANTCAAQTFTVAGVSNLDILISISKPTEQAGLTVTPGHVTGTNTVTANFCNATGVGITPTAAETYQFVTVQ